MDFPRSGRRRATSILSLVLLILSFWSLGTGRLPAVYRQDSGTETPGPGTTPTQTETDPTTPSIATSVTEVLVSPDPSSTAEATLEPDVTGEGDFFSDEVLVGFRRRVSKQAMEDCIRAANASIEAEIDGLSVVLARFADGQAPETISALSTCPGVRYIEPNYEAHIADTVPSDPSVSLQYGLTSIRAASGWDISTGSADVTIAVLDTGVDLGHLDLAGKLVPGYDFVNNDPVPQDDHGHGTHVAGIAAAASNNGTGVAGVSWGARIMPVKVLNAAGNGTFANVAAGITWAADQGAQVINLSLGGSNPSQVLQDAISYADARGVVIVAASGNGGSGFVLYPARYPQVIAVAGTDSLNVRAGFSNYGPEVDLCAPGASIYSTLIGGYGYLSGTSMAAPFVSGLAAVLRGLPGNSSASAIAWQMESTALDLGPGGLDDYYGYGLIQMDAALRAVVPVPTQTSTATLPFPTPTTLAVSLPGGKLPNAVSSLAASPSTAPVTPSPSGGPVTVSPTFSPTGTSLPVGTAESPEVSAMQAEDPELAQRGQDWLLPCLGSFFILLGIFLFWVGRRESRHRRGIKRFR